MKVNVIIRPLILPPITTPNYQMNWVRCLARECFPNLKVAAGKLMEQAAVWKPEYDSKGTRYAVSLSTITFLYIIEEFADEWGKCCHRAPDEMVKLLRKQRSLERLRLAGKAHS